MLLSKICSEGFYTKEQGLEKKLGWGLITSRVLDRCPPR